MSTDFPHITASLRTKLIIVFAGIVFCFIVNSCVMYYFLSRVGNNVMQANHNVEEVARQYTPLSLVAKDIKFDVVQVQQWLTDISATRGQDGLNDGFDKAATFATAFNSDVSKAEKLADTLNLPELKQELKAIKKAFNPYYATGQKMAKAYIAQGPEGGNQVMAEFDKASEDMAESMDALTATVTKLSTEKTEGTASFLQNSSEEAKQSLLITLLIAIFALGTTILSSLWIMRDMRRTVKAMNTTMTEVLHNLAHTSDRTNIVASALASTAEETSGLSGSVSANTEDVLQNLQETKNAMQELDTTTHDIARSVTETVDYTQAVTSRAAEANEVMSNLEKASSRITGVLQFIDEITKQTNLLALNAAIEAARAGDAGKGFAVVADEVRKLAVQIANATTEVAKEIDAVKTVSAQSAHTMSGIIGTVENIQNQMLSIQAAVTEQQATTTGMFHRMTDINRNVANVNSSISDVREASNHTSGSCEEVVNISRKIIEDAENIKVHYKEFINRIS